MASLPPIHPWLDVDAVLFDMDGVLVDTFDAWVEVLEECRARRGISPLGRETILGAWGQGIQADCERFFRGTSPEALAREYDQIFIRHIPRVRAEPGARETVRAIRARGGRAAVVTNTPAVLGRRILEAAGLGGEFDGFAGGDEVAQGKPDPEILFLALGRVGSAPERALLVGDTSADIEAGRAAGVRTVGYRVTGGAVRIEALEELVPLLGHSTAGGSND